MTDISILVVEDDPDHLEITVDALAQCCPRECIATARDGVEALDFLFGRGPYAQRDARRQPRLVILDMKLVHLHGVEVLQAMRADPRTRAVPVVMLSASTEKEALDACYDAGANSVVRKSSDPDELHRKMRQVHDFWITVNEGDRHSRV
ncbi:MAG: response regulator [Comamonadaceae bacterium]|nr:MAG: response regulator [Comamonadaceae bacterium]